MNEYISIKEIAKITGKSETAIRKHIREIIKRNPSVTGSVTKGNLSVTSNGNGNVTSNASNAEPIIKEKTPKGFTYKVDKEFILKELSVTERVTGSVTPSVTGNVTKGNLSVTSNVIPQQEILLEKEVITILNTQLEFLKNELQIKDEFVKDLSKKLDIKEQQVTQLIQAVEKKDNSIEKLRDRVLLLEAPKPEPISDPVVVQKIPEQKQNIIQKLWTLFVRN